MKLSIRLFWLLALVHIRHIRCAYEMGLGEIDGQRMNVQVV